MCVNSQKYSTEYIKKGEQDGQNMEAAFGGVEWKNARANTEKGETERI